MPEGQLTKTDPIKAQRSWSKDHQQARSAAWKALGCELALVWNYQAKAYEFHF